MHTTAPGYIRPIDYIESCDPTAPRAMVFKPTPERRAQVLTDLADYNHSILSIAAKHNITVEALTLWMDSPDIVRALAAIESAAAVHNRLAAATILPRTIPVLLDAVTAYQWEETHLVSDNSLASLASKHKRRESARRATSLLLRITCATPPGLPKRSTPPHPARRAIPRAAEPDTPAMIGPADQCLTPAPTQLAPATAPNPPAPSVEVSSSPAHISPRRPTARDEPTPL